MAMPLPSPGTTMPGPRAATSKQAKASYSARLNPNISDSEKKWLLRGAELDRRAERAQEAERRKTEAARKRLEKEKLVKKEREKVQIGTQRRLDRFGYKSSQFHLGNFFGGQNTTKHEAVEPEQDQRENGSDFSDQDIDDASILEALDSGSLVEKRQEISFNQQIDNDIMLMPPPPPLNVKPRTEAAIYPSPLLANDDLSCFWDELASSSQIEREINGCYTPARERTPTRDDSFSSGSLDLTIEELEQLDPSKPDPSPAMPGSKEAIPHQMVSEELASNTSATRPIDGSSWRLNGAKTVQPLQAPLYKRSCDITSASTDIAHEQSLEVDNSIVPESALIQDQPFGVKRPSTTLSTAHLASSPKRAMLPPALPRKQPTSAKSSPFTSARDVHLGQGPKTRNVNKSHTTATSDFGFTLTQLETSVDDDIQLTQIAPG